MGSSLNRNPRRESHGKTNERVVSRNAPKTTLPRGFVAAVYGKTDGTLSRRASQNKYPLRNVRPLPPLGNALKNSGKQRSGKDWSSPM